MEASLRPAHSRLRAVVLLLAAAVLPRLLLADSATWGSATAVSAGDVWETIDTLPVLDLEAAAPAPAPAVQAGKGGNGAKKKARKALVTIADDENYVFGAIVLAKSMRATGSLPPGTDVLLLVPHGGDVTPQQERFLRNEGGFTHVVRLPRIVPDTFDFGVDRRMNRGGSAKVALFNLTAYRRVLYMDADAFAVKRVPILSQNRFWEGNISGIMEVDTKEPGLKGGLLAVKPSRFHFERLLDLLAGPVDYKNADQGLFNKAFREEWLSMSEQQRIPQKRQLCAVYCVLAALRPQYHSWYLDVLDSALMFDWQGKSKPWDWPPQISIEQCQFLWPWLQVWLGIAYAPSLEHIRGLLQAFNKDRYQREDAVGPLTPTLQEALKLAHKDPEKKLFYERFSLATQSAFKAPFLPSTEEKFLRELATTKPVSGSSSDNDHSEVDRDIQLVSVAGAASADAWRRDHPETVEESASADVCGAAACPSVPQRIAVRPRLFVIDDAFSASECMELVDRGVHLLSPSKVASFKGATRQGDLSAVRTSQDVGLPNISDPIVQRFREAMSAAALMPDDHGEVLQLTRYGPGDKYGLHFDSSTKAARLATVLTFLSDVEEGGHLVFPWAKRLESSADVAGVSGWGRDLQELAGKKKEPEMDLVCAEPSNTVRITPKRGRMVVWFNHQPDLMRESYVAMHGGCPVVKGEKMIAQLFLDWMVPGSDNGIETIMSHVGLKWHRDGVS